MSVDAYSAARNSRCSAAGPASHSSSLPTRTSGSINGHIHGGTHYCERVAQAMDMTSLWQWALLAFVAHRLWRYYQNYIPVPTYGGIVSFSGVLSTIRLTRLGPEAFSRMYSKYPMIQLPRLEHWMVYLQPQFLEEFYRAPDDHLSLMDAAFDNLQVKYVFGQRMIETQDHVNVIRNNLTRHLPVLFPEVLEEVELALSDGLNLEGNEWKKVHAFSFISRVVARASNRIFVGTPMCRDQTWLEFNINGAAEIIATTMLLNLFPRWMLPVVGPIIGPTHRRLRKARKMIGSLIEERLATDQSHWPDDFITWLLLNAPESDRTTNEIVRRLTFVNFVAIHTSSFNISQALYWLLAKPNYIEPLREEVEETVERLGWTKDAIGQMHRLESFMKECMRFTPMAGNSSIRKVMKPFTFSNGVTLPAGAYVAAHLYATHHDSTNYDQPDEFDAFRFLEEKETEEDGSEEISLKPHQMMYTTSKTFLPFGHGRHSCPGRFFAAMELKTIMAYMLVNYDMKWPEEDIPLSARGAGGGYRPENLWFNFNIVPNQTTHMMIRRRV